MEGATLEISTRCMATGCLLPLNSTATRSLSLACAYLGIKTTHQIIFNININIYIYTHNYTYIFSIYIYTHNYTYIYIYSQYDKIDTCHCYTCLYPLYPANLLAAHIHNNAAFFKLATIPSQTSVHPAISPSCPNWRRSPSAKAQALPHLL